MATQNSNQGDQQEFIQVLASISGAKDQKTLESIMQAIGQEGLKVLYQQYTQIKQSKDQNEQQQGLQLMKQTLGKLIQQGQAAYAKFGAKLNYIKSLRGKCPEGYEIEEFKAGGCVKCKKKAMAKENADKVVKRFKSEKCGGKVKKRVSKTETKSEAKKCGGAIKKKVKKGESGVKTKSYYDKNQEEQVTTRTYNGKTFQKREGDGGTYYKGYNGATGVIDDAGRSTSKADSLARAWNKNAEAKPMKVKKHYFGGILDKWL